MNRIFLVLFFSSLSFFSYSPQAFAKSGKEETGRSTDENIKKIDQLFAEWDKPDSPGCALGVIERGIFIYQRGYGRANLNYNIPILPDTVFSVGSVSKQFTAMSIALLARQGRISLDDDVRKYIPELPNYGSTITIKNLIFHTSGIREYTALLELSGQHLEDIHSNDDFLDLIVRQKTLNFNPGEKYLYSNSGYFLLSQIVKRASGQSLREYSDNYIFKPLGMIHTHFQDDRSKVVKNQAAGYKTRQGGGYSATISNFEGVGDVGLVTSLNDLTLWDQNFYRNKLGNGENLINETLTRGQLTNGKQIDYSFGLVTENYHGLNLISHSGNADGFQADFLRFPDEHFSIVCLCNTYDIDPSYLSRRVADIYLSDKFSHAAGDPLQEVVPVRISEKDLKSKTGTYWDPKHFKALKVFIRNGKLMWGRGRGTPPIPTSKDTFSVDGGYTQMIFEKPSQNGPLQLRLVPIDGEAVVYTKSPVITLSRKQLHDLTGEFYSEELDTKYQFLPKNGQLAVKIRGSETKVLTPVLNDIFTHLDLGSITFKRDLNHPLIGFELNMNRISHMQFVKITKQKLYQSADKKSIE